MKNNMLGLVCGALVAWAVWRIFGTLGIAVVILVLAFKWIERKW